MKTKFIVVSVFLAGFISTSYLALPSEIRAGTDFEGVIGWKLKEPLAYGLVYIKGGCFRMGSNSGEGDEKPVHKVCVNDFNLSEHEVTQGEWEEIMGGNPSNFKECGKDCPVEEVSWDDVQEFIVKLNIKRGEKYRLPTEAEWEYAARSGSKQEKWSGTNSESSLGEYAWYDDNSKNKTHPVMKKKPNSFGLYDMSGNVWEWVEDWSDSNYYKSSPQDNPVGPLSGSGRVRRGGSWFYSPEYLRGSYRYFFSPVYRRDYLGFRLARTY